MNIRISVVHSGFNEVGSHEKLGYVDFEAHFHWQSKLFPPSRMTDVNYTFLDFGIRFLPV